MSTLGPVVVAQQVVDLGHVLNEDYLVNSRYLHVRHGVAVARNPPTVPTNYIRRGRSEDVARRESSEERMEDREVCAGVAAH